jgi:hypothetical protein
MEDEIILICAVGRSGSTTLQRFLNTIPNSNICGENWGAVNDLLRFYLNIKKSTQIPGGKTPKSYESLIESRTKPMWYNSYDYEEIVETIKLLITKLFKKTETTSVWGFKEIRYMSKSNDSNDGDIELVSAFKELFPQTKVILHIRNNTEKQSKSGWWRGNWNKFGGNSQKFLSDLNEEFTNFHNKHKDFTYLSTFEDMLDLDKVRSIFEYVGHLDSFDKDELQKILNNRFKR